MWSARQISACIGFASLLVLASVQWRSGTAPDQGLVANQSDFGEVLMSRHHIFEIQIRNLESRSIHIKSFTTSCSCTSVTPSSLTVPPGSTALLKVLVDLTKSRPQAADVETWPFRVNIQPLVDHGTPSLAAWVITAQVRHVVSLATPRISYEATSAIEVGEPVPPRIVELTSKVPMTRLSLTEKTGTWKCRLLDQTPRSARFEITALPFTRAIQQAWDLEFDGQFEGIGSASAVVGRIDAAVMFPVRPLPNFVNFGAVDISQVQRQRIVLNSPAKVPFSVGSVKSSNSDFVIEELSDKLTPDDRSYEIRVQPRRTGPTNGRVTFQVQTSKVPEPFELEVGIAVHGIEKAPKNTNLDSR